MMTRKIGAIIKTDMGSNRYIVIPEAQPISSTRYGLKKGEQLLKILSLYSFISSSVKGLRIAGHPPPRRSHFPHPCRHNATSFHPLRVGFFFGSSRTETLSMHTNVWKVGHSHCNLFKTLIFPFWKEPPDFRIIDYMFYPGFRVGRINRDICPRLSGYPVGNSDIHGPIHQDTISSRFGYSFQSINNWPTLACLCSSRRSGIYLQTPPRFSRVFSLLVPQIVGEWLYFGVACPVSLKSYNNRFFYIPQYFYVRYFHFRVLNHRGDYIPEILYKS